MTEYQAVDISVYQGATDYPLLASKTELVTLRASIGQQEDLLFSTHWDGLEQQAHRIGAYHYFIPYINGVYQAEAMLEILGDRVPVIWDSVNDAFVPGVTADCEYNTGLSPSALSARIKAFGEHITAERPGWIVQVYTRGSWWNTNIGLSQRLYFAACPLWIARYTNTNPEPWGNPGDPSWLRPFPWLIEDEWQRSADGNNKGAEYGVSSDDIDLDVLRNYSTQPPPPDPIPPDPPSEYPQTGKVNAGGGLNLRSYPALDSKYKIRTMPNNTALTIYDELPLQNGYEWTIVRDALGYVGVCASKYVTVDSNI